MIESEANTKPKSAIQEEHSGKTKHKPNCIISISKTGVPSFPGLWSSNSFIIDFEKPIMNLESDVGIDRTTNSLTFISTKNGGCSLILRSPESNEIRSKCERNSSPFPGSSEPRETKVQYFSLATLPSKMEPQDQGTQTNPIFFYARERDDVSLDFLPDFSDETTSSLEAIVSKITEKNAIVLHRKYSELGTCDGFIVYCLRTNRSISKTAYNWVPGQPSPQEIESLDFNLTPEGKAANARHFSMQSFGKPDQPKQDILLLLYETWGGAYYCSGPSGTSITNFDIQRNPFFVGKQVFSDLYADTASDRAYILSKLVPADKGQKSAAEVHQFVRSSTNFSAGWKIRLPEDCLSGDQPIERIAVVADDSGKRVWIAIFVLPANDIAKKSKVGIFYYSKEDTEEEFGLREQNWGDLTDNNEVTSIDVELFSHYTPSADVSSGSHTSVRQQYLDSQGRSVKGYIRVWQGKEEGSKQMTKKSLAASRWVSFFEISVQDLYLPEL